MPEPTNHRAEAEYWIGHAVDAYENAQPVDVVHAKALIGIGHALLAQHDVTCRNHWVEITTGVYQAATGEQIRDALRPSSTPGTPSEREQCHARHDGLRCVLWAGHKDPHRGTWTSE